MHSLHLMHWIILGLIAFLIVRQAQRRPRLGASATSFDLSLATRRFQQKYGLGDEQVAEVEQEFRRFFTLIAENRGKRFGLHNGFIDDYWHELICCTELYRDYCRHVAGRFVDHDPRGGSGTGYARTWWAYQDRFHITPPLLYWPLPEPAERPKDTANDVGSNCSGGTSCGGGSGCGGGGTGCGGGGGCCGGGGCGGGCGGD